MARDYASQNGAKKRQTHNTHGSSSALPGWLWAIIGLSLGLAVAAIVFIVYRPMEQAAAPAQTPSSPTPQTKSPDVPPKTEARFKFYDLLPKSEVEPSEEHYKPKPAAEAAKPQYRYVIQAGSFLAADDAERHKASLALLGFEASIYKVDVPQKGIRYRVQIGPPMDYSSAEKAMRRLADNDIDSYATRKDS